VTVTLDEEAYEQVKAIARAERRSLGNLIEAWVVAEIERRAKAAK
jgi:predicted CopG family antitoxin